MLLHGSFERWKLLLSCLFLGLNYNQRSYMHVGLIHGFVQNARQIWCCSLSRESNFNTVQQQGFLFSSFCFQMTTHRNPAATTAAWWMKRLRTDEGLTEANYPGEVFLQLAAISSFTTFHLCHLEHVIHYDGCLYAWDRPVWSSQMNLCACVKCHHAEWFLHVSYV